MGGLHIGLGVATSRPERRFRAAGWSKRREESRETASFGVLGGQLLTNLRSVDLECANPFLHYSHWCCSRPENLSILGAYHVIVNKFDPCAFWQYSAFARPHR